MPFFDAYVIEARINQVWVNLTPDVVGEIGCSYGIMGNGPLDRVASPGELRFMLDNSAHNSVRTEGYYSPHHERCMPGFAAGIKVRLRITFDGRVVNKFIGRVPVKEGLKPLTGLLSSAKYVEVTARDGIDEMANHTLTSVTLGTDKTAAEGIALAIADMGAAPDGIAVYKEMSSVFPTIFDTARSSSTVLAEISKMVQSELGFFYITRLGLVAEGRMTRSKYKIVLDQYPKDKVELSLLVNEDDDFIVTENGERLLISEATDAQFADEQLAMDVTESSNWYNNVRFASYPRRVDAGVGATLYELANRMLVRAGESAVISGGYKDPDNKAKSVSCIDVVTPAAGVHYSMNTAKDGSGADITADMSATLDWTTGRFFYNVTNNGAEDGYVALKIVGRGVYLDETAEFYVQNDASIAQYGKSEPLIVDMKYQSDPMVAIRWANISLFQYSLLHSHVNSVTFTANKFTRYLSAFLYIEPGDRIRLKENMVGIDQDYFVQGVSFTIQPGGLVEFVWKVRAAAYDVFEFVKWTSDGTPVMGYGTWDDEFYGWDF